MPGSSRAQNEFFRFLLEVVRAFGTEVHHGVAAVILSRNGVERAVGSPAKNAETIDDRIGPKPVPDGLVRVGVKFEVAADWISGIRHTDPILMTMVRIPSDQSVKGLLQGLLPARHEYDGPGKVQRHARR
jgi:hypothetical protein